jgi:hypothetical protein
LFLRFFLVVFPRNAMATDFDNGKAYLMQTDGVAGTSVYDHLSSLIAKLLSEKPANAINILESLSYEIRADRFAAESNLHEQPESSDAVLLAQTQEALLKRQTDVPEDDDEAQQVVPNLPALAQHFEGADIGLGQEETFRIFLALKKLTEEQPLKSVSFWGKPTEPSPPPPLTLARCARVWWLAPLTAGGCSHATVAVQARSSAPRRTTWWPRPSFAKARSPRRRRR